MSARDAATDRAERGDLEAQVELAESLAASGQGEEAALWLERAADAGHPYAATLLGAWQIFGQHVERRPDAGVARVLAVARTANDAIACAFLAGLCAAGIGVEQSWTRALEWLSAAARRTALIYLNEGYEAGETRFPRLEWNFRGATGDALLWRNVDEHGAPDLRTLHIGMPPARGEKWLLSKWIRDRSQCGIRLSLPC